MAFYANAFSQKFKEFHLQIKPLSQKASSLSIFESTRNKYQRIFKKKFCMCKETNATEISYYTVNYMLNKFS